MSSDGPVSNDEAVALDPCRACRPCVADLLEHRDLVPLHRQPGGDGQAAHPGADDDDAAHRTGRPFQVSVPARCRRTESTTSQPNAATDTGCASASGHTRPPTRRATSARPATPAA